MKAIIKSVALPLLVAIYPILFLYGQNVRILNVGILPFPLITALLVAGLAFGLFYLLQGSLLTASLSAAAFALFFHLYGFIHRELTRPNLFAVEHYILLPLVIAVAGYVGYFIAALKPHPAAAIQKILLSITAALLVINLVLIVPVEVHKALPAKGMMPITAASANYNQDPGKGYPDVYYIIFDEYVRFDAMHEYWHDHDVDAFEAFLKKNNFFIASQSLSPTINTTTEMSSRLNLHQYYEKDDQEMLHNIIYDNKVMRIFKAYGYTTVSINMAFSKMVADYNYQFNTNEVGGLAMDEFKQTYLSNTMLDAFSGILQKGHPVAIKQRESIFFALNKTTSLEDIESPKFVYTHFLLPHTPFIFDEDGNLLPPQAAEDWHYYLGQYKYTTKLAQQLVSRLLANADPNNPPIIILQSDEGARNLQRRTRDNIVVNNLLENYPGKYNQYILNALYLPGYDTSKLPANLPPMDAFVIVLNHYLDAGVSVDKAPKK